MRDHVAVHADPGADRPDLHLAPRLVFGVDGLITVAVVHYLAGLVIVLFMLAHIYLGTTGEHVGSMFKMMITGWHEHEKH